MLIQIMLVIWTMKVYKRVHLYFSMRTYFFWKTLVQSIMVMLTTKAEYISVGESAKEALWYVGFVRDLGVDQDGAWSHYDSQSAIFWQTIRCIVSRTSILMQGFTRSNSYLHLNKYYLKWFIL